MKLWFFALKKALATPVFLVFLPLLLLLPAAAFRVGREADRLPAGFVIDGEADRAAALAADYLASVGFLPYDSEDALRGALAGGEIEAGAVWPGDLGSRLKSGEREGLVTFLSAAGSLYAELWRSHAAAALLDAAAPYISLEALRGSGITEEEILSAYDTMMAAGSRFRFEITTAAGAPVSADTLRSRQYLTAVPALFLFAGLFFGAVQPLGEEYGRMKSRLGAGGALKGLLLPGLALRTAVLWLAGAAGLLMAGRDLRLILASAAYLLLLWPVQLLIVFALPGRNASSVAATLILLTALALCPVFADLAGLIPLFAKLRLLCPPYWLYLLAG